MRYLQIYGRVKSLSCSTISYIYQKYIYLLLYFQSEIIFGLFFFFFFQAEDGIRDIGVTGVQTCALPIFMNRLAAIDSVTRSRGVSLRPTAGSRRSSSVSATAAADRTVRVTVLDVLSVVQIGRASCRERV